MTTVVNKRFQEYDVYIGRGSIWGNPFPMDDGENTREVVIAKYRLWLWKEIKEGRITLRQLRSLHGKRLACYCAPKACHGDILVQAVAWERKL